MGYARQFKTIKEIYSEENEHEVPLTTRKANELDIVALYFLLRTINLNEDKFIQIIGGKCELVNEGPCMILLCDYLS